MARNTNKNATAERMFNAVAKQYIKYNREYLKAGEKFQVKESDVKELRKYSEIEDSEGDENNEDFNEKDGKEGENGGE